MVQMGDVSSAHVLMESINNLEIFGQTLELGCVRNGVEFSLSLSIYLSLSVYLFVCLSVSISL